MNEKRISHCQGKGSLTHNNRKFNAKNVDDTRTKNNIIFKQQPISEAYEQLFGAAVERYNSKQKRSDRKIKTSYYEHLFKRKVSQSVVTAADKQKSFYEDVVQIGDKDNTGVGSADAEIAKACLSEYMQSFQERNPNFYVFNAVLHMDEATPHLHIDYIPVGHYTQGVDTRNGIAQALKEMGYGTGKDAIARWRTAECKVLTEICNRHGIQIAAPEKSRGSLTVEQYKEYAKIKEKTEQQRQALNNTENELKQLGAELREKRENIDFIETELTEKGKALSLTSDMLADNQSLLKESAKKVSKIKDIDNIETGKTMFSGKVTISQEDFGNLTDIAKKQIASENKQDSLKQHIVALEAENSSLSAKNNQLTVQVSELKKENSAAKSINSRIELANARSERDNLQRRIDKIMEFIKKLGLSDKLQAFLYQKTHNLHR